MVLGVDHSKKVIADLGKVAVDVIHIAKHGVGLGAIKQILAALEDFKDLAVEAPKAFPELKDIDGAEAAQLAQAAYDMVKAVIQSIVA